MTTEVLPETDAELKDFAERVDFAEWKCASERTLQELWENDKDAVYDTPLEMNK
jgi:hypothetical protein